jgi:hypothetical protein
LRTPRSRLVRPTRRARVAIWIHSVVWRDGPSPDRDLLSPECGRAGGRSPDHPQGRRGRLQAEGLEGGPVELGLTLPGEVVAGLLVVPADEEPVAGGLVNEQADVLVPATVPSQGSSSRPRARRTSTTARSRSRRRRSEWCSRTTRSCPGAPCTRTSGPPAAAAAGGRARPGRTGHPDPAGGRSCCARSRHRRPTSRSGRRRGSRSPCRRGCRTPSR